LVIKTQSVYVSQNLEYRWLAILANIGALAWLLIAPEASNFRQQLGFDLLNSLRPVIW